MSLKTHFIFASPREALPHTHSRLHQVLEQIHLRIQRGFQVPTSSPIQIPNQEEASLPCATSSAARVPPALRLLCQGVAGPTRPAQSLPLKNSGISPAVQKVVSNRV